MNRNVMFHTVFVEDVKKLLESQVSLFLMGHECGAGPWAQDGTINSVQAEDSTDAKSKNYVDGRSLDAV